MAPSQSSSAILLPVLRPTNSWRVMVDWANKGWQNVLAWALTWASACVTLVLLASPWLR
jgi:Mn2+/Fe2+ NRAMP family transporter